jgi:ABC-2 type transport system ATP-binding protein
MLELRGITKKFNNVAVVNDVSFRLEAGEILGYLGPNGAGKSTTVRMLAGLLEQSCGQILFNGRDIDGDLIGYKKRIGYVPEHGELYSYLSGLEYLQLVGRLRQIPEIPLNRKIGGILEQMGLTVEMHLAISGYSKGMKQKILIAAALLHDPDILLLDEPLSGLDISTTLVLKDLFGLLAQKGKIIIYSSHILEVVEKICSRVIILNRGKIVADDSVNHLSELMRLPSLESIFRELVRQTDTHLYSRRMADMMAMN